MSNLPIKGKTLGLELVCGNGEGVAARVLKSTTVREFGK